jgi:hypothetical protein
MSWEAWFRVIFDVVLLGGLIWCVLTPITVAVPRTSYAQTSDRATEGDHVEPKDRT